MQDNRIDGADPGFGVFVISLDFELHWGVRDRSAPDGPYRDNLIGARTAIPRILDLFERFEIAATWATVGFLFAGEQNELEFCSPVLRPRYRVQRFDPYDEPIGPDETSDPLHFGRSLVELIKSSRRQEVASHTFSHYFCLEEGQGEPEFRADLGAARDIATQRGVELHSLVFPRNQVNPRYLRALRDAGFSAYRGNQPGALYRARRRDRQLRSIRMLRLADSYLPLQWDGSTAWGSVVGEGGLCNVAASRFLRPYSPQLSRLEPARLHRITRAVDLAARRHRIFHLWWHPHNFGVNTSENIDFLERVLSSFARSRDRHGIRSLTMHEVAEQATALGDGKTVSS